MLHQQTPWQPAAAWLECEGHPHAGERSVGVKTAIQREGRCEVVGFEKEDWRVDVSVAERSMMNIVGS